MPANVLEYFTAEKQEALLFMVVGAAAILFSAWLLKSGHRLRAAAIPLVAIAAIQLTVGGTVYFRTDQQVANLGQQYEQDVQAYQAAESVRMQIVIDNFVIYRYLEIAFLIAGILMITLLRQRQHWHAAGIGLAVQAGIMLALDYFAEARAAEYMSFIQSLA